MSFSITRKINVDAGHRVPNHGSKCRNLHGHTYIVHGTFASDKLETQGEQEGMVLDFGFMKDVMEKAAHTPCDHATILYYKDPLLTAILDCSVHTPQEKMLQRIKYVIQQSFLDAWSQLPFNSWEPIPREDRGKLYDVMTGFVEQESVQKFQMFLEPQHYDQNHPYSLARFLYQVAKDIINDTAVNELFSIEKYVEFSMEDNRLKVELRTLADRSQAVWFFNVLGIKQIGWEDTQLYITSFVPTAENLAKHWGQRMGLELKLDPRVPPHVYVQNVRVWETPNCFADYTPTK